MAASSADARYYLKLIETQPWQRLGPHRLFKNPAVEAAPLQELAPCIQADIKQVEEHAFAAPSPWHAAAWLMDLAALLGQMADIDGLSGLESPYSPQHGAPVFRGQRNPAWSLMPTLLRAPRDPVAPQALDLFVSTVSELFNYDENRANSRNANTAAAQHYGMATSLLDFTLDPRIAVFFACQGAKQGDPVVVYFIPFFVLAVLGGAVVLPPPWVKRLYLQRGLFLDCSALPESFDLRDHCFRMLFQADEDYAASLSMENLLPPDPWFVRATAWAYEQGEAGRSVQPVAAAVESLIKACGEPPYRWDALRPGPVSEGLEALVDMCEWLALKVMNGVLSYDCDTIQLMWRHNESLFRNHRVVWQLMTSQFGPIEPRNLSPAARLWATLTAITKCVEQESAPSAGG